MKRAELIILLYLLVIGQYMVLSIDSVFWNCFYFAFIDLILILKFIGDFKDKEVSRHLIWSAIIFTGEHTFIMISLLSKDYITYYETLTSFNICLVLVGSIMATFVVVSFFESNFSKILLRWVKNVASFVLKIWRH